MDNGISKSDISFNISNKIMVVSYLKIRLHNSSSEAEENHGNLGEESSPSRI